jgi:hypothetical protein
LIREDDKISLGVPRKWLIVGLVVLAVIELGVMIADYVFRR